MTITELHDWLASNGWHIAPNSLASEWNAARWHAWRSLKVPANDCACNDKPPCLVLYPHTRAVSSSAMVGDSAELDVTGEASGMWLKLRAYSLSPAEARDRMPQIERMLVAAWNAACAAGEAT